LKLEIEPLDDHQVRIIAEFEPEVFDRYIRQAARKVAKQVKIPGFRPGKAPLDVIRRTVGDESLKEQAVEDLVDENYSKILDQAQVKPGAAGSLEEIISLNPPKLAFRIPLEPDVDLGAYKEVRQEYNLEPVSDNEVNEFVKNLQINYATHEPVERPSEKGDLLFTKFGAENANPGEGEEVTILPERPAQFILGGDGVQDSTYPFPGFTDQLVGLSAGDEKTLTHSFSEDEKVEILAGKEVIFKVKVESVKVMSLPDLNDGFAQTVGKFETLEELKNAIREQLERSKKESTDETFFEELLDKVITGATIKYPSQTIDHEVEHMLEHLKGDLDRQGMEMDAYLKMINKDLTTFIEEEIRPTARKRLERSLVIEQLGLAESIQLQESDYNQVAATTMETLRSMPPPKNKKKGVSEQMVTQITRNAMSRMLNQRILDRLKAIATGQVGVETSGLLEDLPTGTKENPTLVDSIEVETPVVTETEINEPTDTSESPSEMDTAEKQIQE